MKTKSDKRVNRSIRKLNRLIQKDVFGKRFELVQISKHGMDWYRSYHWYILLLKDNEQSERNYLFRLDEGEILIRNKHYQEMNRFIVDSDFWRKYNKENLKSN